MKQGSPFADINAIALEKGRTAYFLERNRNSRAVPYRSNLKTPKDNIYDLISQTC
jgi:hypothetical protein